MVNWWFCKCRIYKIDYLGHVTKTSSHISLAFIEIGYNRVLRITRHKNDFSCSRIKFIFVWHSKAVFSSMEYIPTWQLLPETDDVESYDVSVSYVSVWFVSSFVQSKATTRPQKHWNARAFSWPYWNIGAIGDVLSSRAPGGEFISMVAPLLRQGKE